MILSTTQQRKGHAAPPPARGPVGRVFLLSPAHPDGRRAAMLANPRASFPLATGLQRGETRSLGEVFQFLSGLYFRGKLAYARAFARPVPGTPGAFVITSNRGLLRVDTPVTLDELQAFATVPIAVNEPRYREPLLDSTRELATTTNEVVLLGSISTPKYVDPLLEILGARLWFPSEFVGRGDMSRGGLMLRCAREGRELVYQRVAGAVRRGPRPPKLVALKPDAALG